VVVGDFRAVRLPSTPYRVVANPPFSLATALLAHLLDDPRADAALLVMRRRDPPIHPDRLAPAFRDLLRPGWNRR